MEFAAHRFCKFVHSAPNAVREWGLFSINALPHKISYNLSANVYYDEIDPGPFGTGNRSIVTSGGKASFDCKPAASQSRRKRTASSMTTANKQRPQSGASVCGKNAL